MFKRLAFALLIAVSGCSPPKEHAASPAKAVGEQPDSLSQVDRNFINAVSFQSLEARFVLVTVTDRNLGLTKAGCTSSNGLLGAIHREYGLGYDDQSMRVAAEKAMAKPLRHFAFGKADALANIDFSHLDTEDREVCGLVRQGLRVWHADTGQIMTNKDNPLPE